VKYPFEQKINSLLSGKSINNSESLVEGMVDLFYNETISESDKKLLALAFKEGITQRDLDSFVEDWDIEVYGSAKSLILAYIMRDNKNLEFSAYEGPRLSGLLNYYRFSNLKVISQFTRYVRELNKRNIAPLLIKGGAMKYLRQDLPRVMGDTDIVVLGEDFNISCDIASYMGYDFGIDSSEHSVDLHPAGEKSGGVDVHRFIDFETKYNKSFMSELFDRGEKVKVFSADAVIPCAEDLLFIALTNLAKNLHNKTSSAGMLYVLFDCRYLINSKKDFDWDIVLNNVYKTNTSAPVYFAMKFLNRIVPGILPEDLFKDKALERGVKEYCNEVIYFRFYIHDLKMRCKKLKIKNALFDFDVFKQYLRDKPLHFVLKRVRKSPFLVAVFLKLFNK
tara:strand:- start:36 stop:1211 length:1176 start_codon:yes stop_codon:yes gene_type:complete